MRVARIAEHKKWALENLPLPEPGEGQCRVRVDACGICGSDLHFLENGMFGPGLVPGHEMAGTIDVVGPGCGDLSEGQRVTVEPLTGCGTCRSCLEGRPNVCRFMNILGFMAPGGLAEYVIVSHEGLFPVPQDIAPAVAALGEPLAVCVHGLDRGGFEKGQRVLVMGAGAIGLTTLLAARALGAGEVWITARHAHQAELASELGAARVLHEQDATPAALEALGRKTDFDVVVETVGGSADTLQGACAAVRPGGAVSILGLFDRLPELQPFPLLIKECTLSWSNCYCHPSKDRADFSVAARLIDSEREQLARLTTHSLPLSDVAQAFDLAADKSSGAVKVTILP